jgi:5-(carboxyamino)imidazole ribonucleotide mutase
VIEPAVQEHGQLSLSALDGVKLQAADVQQAVVHGGERISLTALAPFATRAHMANPLVGIIMGSKTDLDVLESAVEILKEFGIEHEVRVLSAHRTPEQVLEWSANAESRGLEVLIAGAGGAAHLPGVVAAKTVLPVLGVPVPSTTLGGADALLSIVQMPKGIPVGTLAIGKPGAANAALLAIAILAGKRPELREKLRSWRKSRAEEVIKADKSVSGS